MIRVSSSGIGPFIWASRGRTWGVRFLHTGGLENPLSVYEEAFATVGDQPTVWKRVGNLCALRFLDPQGRRDGAGRVIPLEFVLMGPWADEIGSPEEARERLWQAVAEEFERVWAESEPPTP
jgi:hypothetical protein